jgi:hypothetical protein
MLATPASLRACGRDASNTSNTNDGRETIASKQAIPISIVSN